MNRPQGEAKCILAMPPRALAVAGFLQEAQPGPLRAMPAAGGGAWPAATALHRAHGIACFEGQGLGQAWGGPDGTGVAITQWEAALWAPLTACRPICGRHCAGGARSITPSPLPPTPRSPPFNHSQLWPSPGHTGRGPPEPARSETAQKQG